MLSFLYHGSYGLVLVAIGRLQQFAMSVSRILILIAMVNVHFIVVDAVLPMARTLNLIRALLLQGGRQQAGARVGCVLLVVCLVVNGLEES